MKKQILLFLFLSVFLIGLSGPANATTIGLEYHGTSPPGESGNFSIIGSVLYGTYRLDVDWDLSGIRHMMKRLIVFASRIPMPLKATPYMI